MIKIIWECKIYLTKQFVKIGLEFFLSTTDKILLIASLNKWDWILIFILIPSEFCKNSFSKQKIYNTEVIPYAANLDKFYPLPKSKNKKSPTKKSSKSDDDFDADDDFKNLDLFDDDMNGGGFDDDDF